MENFSQVPAPAANPHPVRSRGERLFNWGVYGGLAGIGTFLVTVPVAYELEFGRFRWFHANITRRFEWAAKIMPWKTTGTFAEGAAMTTTLMQGGNVMLLPVGVAEHFKVPIVETLNHLLGDPTPAASIEEAPKQTWGSLIKARATAWLVVLGSMLSGSMIFPKSMDMFKQEFAERFCQIMRKPILAPGAVPSKTFLYGKLGALDVFATAAAATLLYVAGHIFARQREKKIELKAELKSGGALRDDAMETASPVNPAVNLAQPGTHIDGEKIRHGALEENLQARTV